MTSKHFNWHKSWSIDQDGHLIHTSSLKVLVEKNNASGTVLVIDDASVLIFKASEYARGVPAHQHNERLMRLFEEAQTFLERSVIKRHPTHRLYQ